jgi:hypothetical protein
MHIQIRDEVGRAVVAESDPEPGRYPSRAWYGRWRDPRGAVTQPAGVNVPMQYGEGDRAFIQPQEEVSSADNSPTKVDIYAAVIDGLLSLGPKGPKLATAGCTDVQR